jgi:hypothetical protein
MISAALALALLAQDASDPAGDFISRWFKAHLKNADTAKIEEIKPPRTGRRSTGGGWGGSVFAGGHEDHVVTYHCYRVSERAPDGSYASPTVYLMTLGANGKMYEVKTSPRKISFPGREKIDTVVGAQCEVH